jgi:fructokinase
MSRARARRRAPDEAEVLVAGEALWDLAAAGGASFDEARTWKLRAGGAAVNVALELRRLRLPAALAARVGDDALGRALRRVCERARVDVRAVAATEARTGLLVAAREGSARAFLAYRAANERPPAVPAGPRRALVLTGLLPTPGWAAAARAARSAGALVFLDVNARRRVWRGRAGVPRAVRGVLRASHAVKVSDADLEVLGASAAELRAHLHPRATLIWTRGPRAVRIEGPFGAFSMGVRELRGVDELGAGDLFTAALVAALVKSRTDLGSADGWRLAARSARDHVAARLAERPH